MTLEYLKSIEHWQRIEADALQLYIEHSNIPKIVAARNIDGVQFVVPFIIALRTETCQRGMVAHVDVLDAGLVEFNITDMIEHAVLHSCQLRQIVQEYC